MIWIAFFVFMYFFASLVLKSGSSTEQPLKKEQRINILNALEELLEKYSNDIINLYDENIQEVELLIRQGKEEEAKKKIENFKSQINGAILNAKKDLEIERRKI